MEIVELEPDRTRELVDELAGIDEVEGAHPLVQEPRGLVEQREVGLDLGGRRRPLHLHRDLSAVREHRAVDLPDRCGRHRHDVELEERPLDGQVELGLDDVSDVVEPDRADRVLEPAELGDDVRGHDVRAGREQLTELHERRPELVEHLAQPPPAVGRALVEVGALSARQEVADAVLAERVPEAVARGDLCDLGQAPEAPR